jgi:tetratricopeptide (TPR) repeat protein
MKNEKFKYYIDSSLATSAFKYCLYVLCLTLMPFDLLSFVTGTASANSEQLVEYKLTQDNFTDSNDSSVSLKRQLWKSDITPIASEKDRNKKDELKELIEQIRAIEVQPQEQAPKLVAPPKIIPAAEPDVSEVTSEPVVQKKPEYEPNLTYTPISSETLKILGNLSQNPKQIDNPMELGEMLFHNGNYKEAVLFYQEALIRTESNNPDTAMNRAWILFQTGNCLRNSDMPGAAKIYGQLITEFPNSLWARMAMVQSQFITWYQKDEPQKLINDNNPKVK